MGLSQAARPINKERRHSSFATVRMWARRNSSFVYKGKAVDVRQVGREWACAMSALRAQLGGDAHAVPRPCPNSPSSSNRGASLGRQIRRKTGGRFRPAGSDHRKSGWRRRAEPSAVGDRTLQRPKRLETLDAYYLDRRFASPGVCDACGRQDRRGVSGRTRSDWTRTTPPPTPSSLGAMRFASWAGVRRVGDWRAGGALRGRRTGRGRRRLGRLRGLLLLLGLLRDCVSNARSRTAI